MKEFTVQARYDPEARVWWGSSDELPVTSEAETFEALMERVMQIAPEMAEINGHAKDGEEVKIHFTVDKVTKVHG